VPAGNDPKKFPILVASKGDFVLLAAMDDRHALEKILDAKESVASVLKPAREWLDEQDISGVCTPTGVKFGIAMILAGPTGIVGSSTPGQVARMKETFAEAERNIKLVAFGSRIEKEGHARLLTRVYFDAEGSYAAWMAKATPLAGEILGRLPDQPYLVAALARVTAQTNFEGLRWILPEKMPVEEANKLTKQCRELVQRITRPVFWLTRNPALARARTRRTAPTCESRRSPRWMIRPRSYGRR